MNKDWEEKIYYSQCWEDPEVLLEGLGSIKNGRILSVTSGGCNTLSLLLGDPATIVAADLNPAQNHLLRLKMAAIKVLSHADLLAFVGIYPSKSRWKTFMSLASHIEKESFQWWLLHRPYIEMGLLHCGRFEQFINIFRTRVLPLIHSKKTRNALFLNRDSKAQADFYKLHWNSFLWRFFFKLFFSKTMFRLLGRNPALFQFVEEKNVAAYYLKKGGMAFSNHPDRNWFLRYIIQGTGDEMQLPLWLQFDNLPIIRERLDRIKIITNDLENLLKQSQKSFDGFNLSNVFESLSPEVSEEVFKCVANKSNSGARMVHISHLVLRSPLDKRFHKIDIDQIAHKAFFYRAVHVHAIHTK